MGQPSQWPSGPAALAAADRQGPTSPQESGESQRVLDDRGRR